MATFLYVIHLPIFAKISYLRHLSIFPLTISNFLVLILVIFIPMLLYIPLPSIFATIFHILLIFFFSFLLLIYFFIPFLPTILAIFFFILLIIFFILLPTIFSIIHLRSNQTLTIFHLNLIPHYLSMHD